MHPELKGFLLQALTIVAFFSAIWIVGGFSGSAKTSCEIELNYWKPYALRLEREVLR